MRVHATLLSGLLLPLPLAAQVTAPGAHWGTSLYPANHPEERFSIETHRFTQFSSSGAQHPSQIQQTAGFNLFKLSVTRELLLDLDHRLTWTVEGGVGLSNDQPSEWLQNDYLHSLRNLNKVPVGQQRRATEFAGGGAINYWLGTEEPHGGHEADEHESWRWAAFAGLGAATSTLYHEAFIQVGGSVFFPSVNTRLSLLGRTSWPNGGEAYPRVAHWNNVYQLGVSYVPDSWFMGNDGTLSEILDAFFDTDNLPPWRWPSALHTLIGRPECGLYVTYDDGFFVTPAGSEIDTWFMSIRFDWPTGMRMETYNDMANGTDFGPTFGLLISWDLATFLRTR